MKKIILTLALLTTTLIINAQHSVKSPHADLKVKVVRAIESEGTAVIDLILTNLGAEEEITFVGSNMEFTIAYDDEGNRYTLNNSRILVGSETLSQGKIKITLPTEIPLKFRVKIENVDPYATKFTMIKIAGHCWGKMNLRYENPIILRDITFERK